jgi:long-chain acyl-CoA synthetase
MDNNKEAMSSKQEVEEDTICEIIFTTGTTGNPKGAMHSENGIISNTWNTIHGIGMKSNDIVLLSLPLSHSFGLRVMRACILLGTTIVLQNGSSFSKETCKNIIKYSCTGFACVTASMKMMIEQLGESVAADVFGKLRYIEFSAGAVESNYRKYLVELLPNTEIHNTWGSTESGGCFFLNVSKQINKIESMGKPRDLVQTKILHYDGYTANDQTSPHACGILSIRGDMLMTGYWGDPLLTENAMKDGWLITNDLVWKDKDGFFYMLGRVDDMINVGGEKVSPVEIEEILLESPEIKECACIGVQDTKGNLGEVPILFICREKKCNDINWKKQILCTLTLRLDQYKIPTDIIEMELLPRNKMGKIDRNEIRKSWKKLNVESSQNPVLSNIFKRKSIRNFTDKEVSSEIIDLLLACGKSAPSGRNLHTRRFTVIYSKEEIEAFKNVIYQAAQRSNITVNGFYNPKVIIFVSDDRRNKDGIQDVSCAVENIMLAATSIGLGSVWLNMLMDLCDEENIREYLTKYDIPTKHWVWATVAIGWPTNDVIFSTRKEDTVKYF